ncbi:hypothetical protein [Nisaea sp.]|uniref:hypothetical protein n=1 Tax=Nisaea sp. TaxID=2024842 RepID=UPI003B5157FD
MSSIGSFGAHLVPLTIAAAIAGAGMSVPAAGWIATALLCGQLATTLLLPIVGVRSIGRKAATVSIGMLLLSLVLAGSDADAAMISGWFFVGVFSGVLHFLGTVEAAHSDDPVAAFSLRLSLVLVLVAALIAIVQWIEAGSDYQFYLGCFGGFSLVIAVLGLLQFRPRAVVSAGAETKGETVKIAAFGGLAVLWLFFVGQTGLLGYVLVGASRQGLGLVDAAWAFAAVKITAALGLAVLNRRKFPGNEQVPFLALGIALAGGGYAMTVSTSTAGFFVMFAIFEICFNSVAARLQGAVSKLAAAVSGRWIAATALLGAAVGPPIHGYALGLGAEALFQVFAACSALLPALWCGIAIARLR